MKATACPLCARKHETKAAPTLDRRDELVPWALAITAAAAIASIGIAYERPFGIGAVVGLVSGAILARSLVRRALQAKKVEHDCVVKALSTEADDRVTMLIRQFEWAVNDVMKLRREGERAQVTTDLLVVQGRARERHIRKLERDLLDTRQKLALPTSAGRTDEAADPDQVVFRFGLHDDGAGTRLELDCDGRVHRPTRVRLVDREGALLAMSHTPMHSGDGTLSFALIVPAGFHDDLDPSRASTYRLEAQHEHGWRPARLADTGRRTRLVADKQGRVYRLSATADATRTTACPRHNPFDADNAFFTL